MIKSFTNVLPILFVPKNLV